MINNQKNQITIKYSYTRVKQFGFCFSRYYPRRFFLSRISASHRGFVFFSFFRNFRKFLKFIIYKIPKIYNLKNWPISENCYESSIKKFKNFQNLTIWNIKKIFKILNSVQIVSKKYLIKRNIEWTNNSKIS